MGLYRQKGSYSISNISQPGEGQALIGFMIRLELTQVSLLTVPISEDQLPLNLGKGYGNLGGPGV